MALYILHRHRVCLVDCMDLICSLNNWWEGFGSSSLATLPLGFNCGFISTSTCGLSTEVQLLGLPFRAWVCPCEGQVQMVQLLGSQGFWQHQVLMGVGGQGSRKYSAQEGYDSVLAWRTPSLTDKPGWPQSERKKMKSLSCVRLIATPRTVACSRLLRPWDFLGKSTGVGCHFLLQGIFPGQGSNPALLHCRQTFYHLSHKGSRYLLMPATQ